MTLQTILERIKNLKPYVDQDLREGHYSTLDSLRARQRNAIEETNALKREYFNSLKNSAVFIVVSGQNKEEFAQTAVSEFHCFSADTMAMFKDLASRVPKELYLGKVATAVLYDNIQNHLSDKATEMGISAYPMFSFKAEYQRNLDTQEDLENACKKVVLDQVGAELVGIESLNSILDKAVAMGHSATLTPVVLQANNDAEALQMVEGLKRLSKRAFAVNAGKLNKGQKTTAGILHSKDGESASVKETLTKILSLSVGGR